MMKATAKALTAMDAAAMASAAALRAALRVLQSVGGRSGNLGLRWCAHGFFDGL